MILRTDSPKPPIGNRIRKNSIIQQREKIPLMRHLGLKIPPRPALHISLERIDLGLDEGPCIVLHRLVPGADIGFPGAGAVEGGAGVGAVVAGADAVAVEGRGAVCHGSGPFADEGPFVGAAVAAGVVADGLAVLPWRYADVVVVEDLVVVVI